MEWKISNNLVHIKWIKEGEKVRNFTVGLWSHAEDFYDRVKDLRKKSGIYAMRTYQKIPSKVQFHKAYRTETQTSITVTLHTTTQPILAMHIVFTPSNKLRPFSVMTSIGVTRSPF